MIREQVKVPLEVPQWLGGYHEIYVTRVLVKAGQTVGAMQDLVELGRRDSGENYVGFGIVPSPVRATVEEILVAERGTVSIGQPIVTLQVQPRT